MAAGTVKRRPETCDHCREAITYYEDPGGTWAECACDAGYLI
jgi:hypothetical protein